MPESPKANFETVEDYAKELKNLFEMAAHDEREKIIDMAIDFTAQALLEFNGDIRVTTHALAFFEKLGISPYAVFGQPAHQAVKQSLGKPKDALDKERAIRVIHCLQEKLRPFGQRIEDACRDRNDKALGDIFSEIVQIATPAVIVAEGEMGIARRLSREIIDDQLCGKTNIITNQHMLALEYRLGALVLENVIKVVKSGVEIDSSDYQKLPPLPELSLVEQERNRQMRRLRIVSIFAQHGLDIYNMPND